MIGGQGWKHLPTVIRTKRMERYLEAKNSSLLPSWIFPSLYLHLIQQRFDKDLLTDVGAVPRIRCV